MHVLRFGCHKFLPTASKATWRPCPSLLRRERPPAQQSRAAQRHQRSAGRQRIHCSAAEAMPSQQEQQQKKQQPGPAPASPPAWTQIPIILGSQSASRRGIMDELAREFGFSYSTVSADIDEKAIRVDDPEQLVMTLAAAKAQAIVRRWLASEEEPGFPDAGLLITCDQVVLCDEEVLEKPESEEQARQYIQGYSENSAQTIGSVRILNLASGRSVAGTDVCEVQFAAIPDDVVDKLVADKATYSCAGGLMVEHPLVSPLIEAQFGEQASIMGLPKGLAVELLRKAAFLAPADPADEAPAINGSTKPLPDIRRC